MWECSEDMKVLPLGAGMTNRDMEQERERREWEQSELQELDDLQAKHARIDERLEVGSTSPLSCQG